MAAQRPSNLRHEAYGIYALTDDNHVVEPVFRAQSADLSADFSTEPQMQLADEGFVQIKENTPVVTVSWSLNQTAKDIVGTPAADIVNAMQAQSLLANADSKGTDRMRTLALGDELIYHITGGLTHDTAAGAGEEVHPDGGLTTSSWDMLGNRTAVNVAFTDNGSATDNQGFQVTMPDYDRKQVIRHVYVRMLVSATGSNGTITANLYSDASNGDGLPEKKLATSRSKEIGVDITSTTGEWVEFVFDDDVYYDAGETVHVFLEPSGYSDTTESLSLVTYTVASGDGNGERYTGSVFSEVDTVAVLYTIGWEWIENDFDIYTSSSRVDSTSDDYDSHVCHQDSHVDILIPIRGQVDLARVQYFSKLVVTSLSWSFDVGGVATFDTTLEGDNECTFTESKKIIDAISVTASRAQATEVYAGSGGNGTIKLDSATPTGAATATISATITTTTIVDAATNFVTAGFEAGHIFRVSGSASNDGVYTIDTITSGGGTNDVITVQGSGLLVAEGPTAGVVVTALTDDDIEGHVAKAFTDVYVVCVNGEQIPQVDALTDLVDPCDRDRLQWFWDSTNDQLNFTDELLNELDVVRIVGDPATDPSWQGSYELTSNPGDQGALFKGELDIRMITNTTLPRVIEGLEVSDDSSSADDTEVITISAGTFYLKNTVTDELELWKLTEDTVYAVEGDSDNFFITLTMLDDAGTGTHALFIEEIADGSPGDITDNHLIIALVTVGTDDVTNVVDARECHRHRLSLIQTATYSADLARETIMELGNEKDVERSLNKPVSVTTDVSAKDSDSELAVLLHKFDQKTAKVTGAASTSNVYDAAKLSVTAVDTSVVSGDIIIARGSKAIVKSVDSTNNDYIVHAWFGDVPFDGAAFDIYDGKMTAEFLEDNIGIQTNLYTSKDRKESEKTIIIETIDSRATSESLSASVGGDGEFSFSLLSDNLRSFVVS